MHTPLLKACQSVHLLDTSAAGSVTQRVCHVQEYKQACEAFLGAEKLDPGNEEIKRELQ